MYVMDQIFVLSSLSGGGAYKYMDLLTSKLGLRWDIGLSKDGRKIKREWMKGKEVNVRE